MSPEVTIQDLNYILEFGTLHGKVDNFVCQTSRLGTQQIKIITDLTYKENATNTALRIRARSIFSYAMSSWNPQTHDNFRSLVKELYDQTIYLFFTGTITLKAQYFQIYVNKFYTFVNRTTEEIIYSGFFAPNQFMEFIENSETQYFIDCYYSSEVVSSLEIKVVSPEFNISQYYKDLF